MNYSNYIDQFKKIKLKYPLHIGMLVIFVNESNVKIITKFLVQDKKFYQVMIDIRRHLKINKYQSFFTFTENNTILNTNDMLSSIFNTHNRDGLLILEARLENTFG